MSFERSGNDHDNLPDIYKAKLAEAEARLNARFAEHDKAWETIDQRVDETNAKISDALNGMKG